MSCSGGVIVAHPAVLSREGDTMEEKYCISCGGTGEAYIGALAGDGWTGRTCEMCNGCGAYYLIDGKHYVMDWPNKYAKKPILRGPDGRFYTLPEGD